MRFVILIAVSLILAAAVVFIMLGQKKAPVQQVEDGHFLLISKVDIEPGSFIKAGEYFTWQEYDATKFPEKEQAQFMQKSETNLAEIDGAVVRRFIKAGQPVMRNNLVTPKEGGFMSAVLYPGMRAVSVGVNLVSGNAGFIFPGDKVDLLLTHEVNDDDGKRSFATETFIKNVRVLAIDQKVSNPEKTAFIPKTVTLEVTPKQAEEVLVAEELGKISLILRSMGSVSFNQINAIDSLEPTFENGAENKGYTLDNDVSKIITHQNPIANTSSVTITRGRTTEKVTLEQGASENIPSNTPEQQVSQ